MKKLTNALLIICAVVGIGAIIFMLPIREIKDAFHGAINLCLVSLAIVCTCICFIKESKNKAWYGIRFGLSTCLVGTCAILAILKPIQSNTIPIFILIAVGIVLIVTAAFNIAIKKNNS